jgi:hypothetical protein
MTDDERTLHEAVKAAAREALEEKVDEAVAAQMPEALGGALGPLIHAAVRADFKRYRLQAIVGFLVLALGLGYAIRDNRERSTRARGVVCQIITAGDSTAYAYEREGTISRRQLLRALRQSAEYRALLGPAPACSPGLTPPPRRPAAVPTP